MEKLKNIFLLTKHTHNRELVFIAQPLSCVLINMWYFLILISSISFQIISPKFVLSVSHLTDQETDLENSSERLRRIKSEQL